MDIVDELNARESGCLHVFLANAPQCKVNEFGIIRQGSVFLIYRPFDISIFASRHDVNLWLNCSIGTSELVRRSKKVGGRCLTEEEIKDFLRPVY